MLADAQIRQRVLPGEQIGNRRLLHDPARLDGVEQINLAALHLGPLLPHHV